MRPLRWLAIPLLLGASCAGWSCQGQIGNPGGTGEVGGVGGSDGLPANAPVSFECDEAKVPDAVPLRRLSNVQLRNTVRDLLERTLPGDAEAIYTGVETTLNGFPADTRKGPEQHWGGFTRVDQSVTQEHVDRDYDLAVALGAALTADDGRLSQVAGDCATDSDGSNDAACLDAFVRSFGERVLRKQLSDEDVTFYQRPAGSAPFDRADWADVIALMVAAPNFFYMVEHGADEAVSGKTDLYPVSAYELASRLSYHFWQSMPDDTLLAKARDGSLFDPDVYRAEVDRLFEDPRTRLTIRQFYSEWFRRADLAQLNTLVGTAAYDELRQDFDPSPNLRQDMYDEVTDMALYYTLDTPGHVEDFYRSRKSFARSQELADFYHVPVWDGSGEPPDFSEPERQGLLTRAAMVATGSANTRPIMKGVFIRRALLCDTLPNPPANVMATAPEPAVDATSRQVVENLTGTGICPDCHAKAINPLGFATENFDALGRPRDVEKLIDLVTGEVHGEAPVDTEVVARVNPEDEDVVKDGIELQEKMIESGKVQACFARAYFRFTFGRKEHVGKDACALDVMHQPLEAGQPIQETLRVVALSDAFVQRNFGDR
ncbi:MAG: DUF1592 domain-containing protein [Polyangiaceae bacterium]